MRARLLLVGFLCVTLVLGATPAQETTPALPPPAAPQLSIDVEASTIELHGVVSSEAHESILARMVAEYFDGKTAVLDLSVRPALPPGWALITEMTLRSLASMRTATAEISDTRIVVNGISASAEDWDESAARIANRLLPGMTFSHEVVEIRSPGSMHRQCIELFRTAMRGRKIKFPRSSAVLSTSASPLLDELIQIATDCPDTTVEITGHTDSTGDEFANQALSEQRANAVASYMISGGIAAERITAIGAGSSTPMVEESSSQARQLNRRIDIELRFPDG